MRVKTMRPPTLKLTVLIAVTLTAFLVGFAGFARASTNVLTNPGAETGNLNGWTVYNDHNNGWGLRTFPVRSGTYGFASSYYNRGDPNDYDNLSQLINLTAQGYTAAFLDSAPNIYAGSYVIGVDGRGSGDYADPYYVKVQLMDENQAVIQTYYTGILAGTSDWVESAHDFTGYGSGARYVYFEQGGKDTEWWAGQFGACFDDAYVYVVSSLSASFGTNPEDNYTSNSRNATFDFKCAGTANVSTIQLWTNFSGVWAANYSNSSYVNNSWLNVTVAGIPDGSFVWGVWCNDSASNSAWTAANRTLVVDATPPSAVVYVSPTPLNGSYRNYNYSFVNVTFSEANPDSCVFDYVYSNSTERNLTMTRAGNNCFFNVTTQPDGQANFTVYVNDSAGNWGANTTYYRFFIDTTAPVGL